MADDRTHRGLLDTSVVVDLDRIDPGRLPAEIAISTITLAELAAGTHVAQSVEVRAERQELLQRVEAEFAPIPLDGRAARAYGRLYAAVTAAGRNPRRRALDLLIAATAAGADIPLYTANSGDLRGLEDLVAVRPVNPA